MACRIVQPETTLLKISQGDWLLVKRRLTHGEENDAFARRYKATATGHMVDLARVDLAQVVAYLLDWSLEGPSGQKLVILDQPAEVVENFLLAIDGDSFREIQAAVLAHVMAEEKAREERKNSQDGATGSPATSPSRAPAAGELIGSAT